VKNNILIIGVLIVISILVSGCGASKSQQMAKSSLDKYRTQSKAFLNTQQAGPDVESLKQYAVSERSKYFCNLLSLHDKNPDAIPTVLMDPATNKEAKQKNAADFTIAKASIIKMGKRNRMSKSVIANFVKTIEKDFKKPFYKMTKLPRGATDGTIRISENAVVSKSYGIAITFEYDNEVSRKQLFNDLVNDFNVFLSHDSGWKKKTKETEQLTEDTIELLRESIAWKQQSILELGSSKAWDTRKKQLEASIQKDKNNIADFKKTLKSLKKKKYQEKQVLFQYNWNQRSNGHLDMYVVGIVEQAGRIVVSINKTLMK